jgi:hypothetical protein
MSWRYLGECLGKPSYRKRKIKGKRMNFAFSFIPLPFDLPDAYFMLARASLTAAKKNNPVRGILKARIIAVT